MTSQEKLDSISALFKQAEAELAGQKPITDLSFYNTDKSGTEMRSTTIKTVHEIHSIEKSMSINKSEERSHEEIKRSESTVQQLNARTEQSTRLRKSISELYELAVNDTHDLFDSKRTLTAIDSSPLEERQTDISATMAEIAHTVKAIPTVKGQKVSPANEIVDQGLKSQILEIVETATRDIIRNEMRYIFEDLLTKRLDNKSSSSNKKAKKTQTKKTLAKKTKAKKTKAKKRR